MSYENVPKNLTEKAVLVRGGRPDYLTLAADPFPTPTADEAGAILEHIDTGDRFRWSSTAWVQTQHIGFAMPIEVSSTGNVAVPVNSQDLTTQAIDVWFTEKKGIVTTQNAVLQGGYTVDLNVGHGAVIGDVIEARTAENYVQSEIINVVGDTITVNNPWSRDFPSGVVLDLGDPNLNVLGSIITNRIFSIAPSTLQKIHITRIMITMQDASAMDFSTFGGIAGGLAIGCLLRELGSDGNYTNNFNWRDNGEFIDRAFDHRLQSKIGGGLHAFAARSTWAGMSKRGVVLPLDGALLEELEIIVQDDLTGLDKYRAVAQGHVVLDQ